MRDEPRVLLAVALGALIGLAALTRAEGLLFVVLLACPPVWPPAGRAARAVPSWPWWWRALAPPW